MKELPFPVFSGTWLSELIRATQFSAIRGCTQVYNPTVRSYCEHAAWKLPQFSYVQNDKLNNVVSGWHLSQRFVIGRQRHENWRSNENTTSFLLLLPVGDMRVDLRAISSYNVVGSGATPGAEPSSAGVSRSTTKFCLDITVTEKHLLNKPKLIWKS